MPLESYDHLKSKKNAALWGNRLKNAESIMILIQDYFRRAVNKNKSQLLIICNEKKNILVNIFY